MTPGYFDAMQERVVRGRGIEATDRLDGVLVIAVNETLAREYFHDEDPLGHRIRIGGPNEPWRTIVGVIGDVHHQSLTTPVKRKFFVPHAQWGNTFGSPRRTMTLVARTSGDARALATPVGAIVRAIDADVPLNHVETSGRRARRRDPGAALHDGAHGGFRRARTAARGRRDLRRDLVRREPAHA